jgi:hypothetical protein
MLQCPESAELQNRPAICKSRSWLFPSDPTEYVSEDMNTFSFLNVVSASLRSIGRQCANTVVPSGSVWFHVLHTVFRTLYNQQVTKCPHFLTIWLFLFVLKLHECGSRTTGHELFLCFCVRSLSETCFTPEQCASYA